MVCCVAAMAVMAGLAGAARAAMRLVGLERPASREVAFAPAARRRVDVSAVRTTSGPLR